MQKQYQELSKHDKIYYIKHAAEYGVSGIIIEPSRKGATVSELKKNRGNPTKAKIDSMFENLMKHLNQNHGIAIWLDMQHLLDTDPKAPEPSKDENPSYQPNINLRLQAIESQLKSIFKQVYEIQKFLENSPILHRVHENFMKVEESAIPLRNQTGFNFRQEKTTSKGIEYIKWYATKNIKVNGQRQKIRIYIGENFDQQIAQAKIDAYLTKHPEIQDVL